MSLHRVSFRGGMVTMDPVQSSERVGLPLISRTNYLEVVKVINMLDLTSPAGPLPITPLEAGHPPLKTSLALGIF